MKHSHGIEEKSRLGRLLVNRGYLSDSQLKEGLQLQRDKGQRLGEVFVESGWITERELHRCLKHQKRYRNAAVLVTLVALPFQPLVSFAASSQVTNDQGTTDVGQMISEGKFKPMTNAEMAGVSGKGDAFVPVLNFLDSDLAISGVHYRDDVPRFAISNDGGLELALPEHIEQIRMDNIRVGSGPSMGNVTISDVRFHVGSSMTIHNR